MDFNNALLDYIETQSDSPFDSNLFLGEIIRNVEGCYAVATTNEPPDMYTGVEYRNIAFWSLTAETDLGYSFLDYIYGLFHQAHHYNLDGWYVFFSHALSTVDDMDRNGEGYKMWRCDIRFIVGRTNQNSS